MAEEKRIDVLWDDNPVDITQEANFIWSIANKLRGTYMPDKYGDVIIPMTIIRRFECALSSTKQKVVDLFDNNSDYPAKAFEKITGYQFYNVSRFTLKELTNDPDNLSSNFKDYINGFSENVQDILKQLKIVDHIETMDEGGCLYSVVKAFSELDLNPKTYDSIKMGYIFENLIGRFFQNVDAGQFYTGRDIIKMMVSILISEGCEDIYQDHKVITVCDQACGTGGMLSTSYSYLKHINPTADVRLFGQEFMGPSYAVGLAEMLIKGQDSRNFRHADTFKQDCFPDTKMRFVIENPPFGTPWSGKDAKEGQEEAVKQEYAKREIGPCRWGAGLPSGGDSQLIFLQSAIDKMDPKNGRATIIENGSAFTGGTSSGESQIRKWILENDLVEAIIALPPDLFYNTPIQTYVWVLSKNKKKNRIGKVQLIDASKIFHKLRKSVGNKKNEFTPEDRKQITQLYTDFKENDFVQIFDNEDFLYREYSIYQPYQRSYSITEKSIDRMISLGYLASFFDQEKIEELRNQSEELTDKDKKKLDNFLKNKDKYFLILKTLEENISDKVYYSISEFESIIKSIFLGKGIENKVLDKIIEGLSIMDKKAEILRDKKGNIIYDKETKETEIVGFKVKIDDYMKNEVLPYVPDARAFFEEDLTKNNPVIKTGADIQFSRYFYEYPLPEDSKVIAKRFLTLENATANRVKKLFGGNN